jgi:hypothetical protein
MVRDTCWFGHLVCGTVAQSLSTTFTYTLYKRNKSNGSEAYAVKQKFRSCFCEDKWFEVAWESSYTRILEGESLVYSEDMEDVTDTVCYKYARLVTMWCETYIFSIRITFPWNRRTFTIRNVKMAFAVHCINASHSVSDADTSCRHGYFNWFIFLQRTFYF